MSFSQKNITDSSDELVVNFVASENNQIAKIELDNSFFQDNLLQKKLILSFAQFDNTAVPLFIPKKLNAFPSYVDQPNLINFYNEISVYSINYVIAMNNVNSLTGAKWAVLNWVPVNNMLTPPSSLLNQKQVYANPFYYSYTVSHMLKIIENALIYLFKAVNPLAVGDPQFEVVFNGTTFTIIAPETVGSPAVAIPSYIFINPELVDLLRLNTYKLSAQSEMSILLQDTQKNYNGVDSILYNSRYISNSWVAFDTILITTNLPLKSVEYQSNVSDSNQSSTEYRNVVFALNTLSSSVNFYPYYEYLPQSTDLFKSFSQNIYNQPTFILSFYLYDKRTGLSVDYRLNKNELITLDFLIKVKN